MNISSPYDGFPTDAVTIRPVVYVAHPYSKNPNHNAYSSCVNWDTLNDTVSAVFINPLWSHLQDMICPREYNTWLLYDFQLILNTVDAVLCCGRSKGVDAERELAIQLGLPVFDTIHELEEWLSH